MPQERKENKYLTEEELRRLKQSLDPAIREQEEQRARTLREQEEQRARTLREQEEQRVRTLREQDLRRQESRRSENFDLAKILDSYNKSKTSSQSEIVKNFMRSLKNHGTDTLIISQIHSLFDSNQNLNQELCDLLIESSREYGIKLVLFAPESERNKCEQGAKPEFNTMYYTDTFDKTDKIKELCEREENESKNHFILAARNVMDVPTDNSEIYVYRSSNAAVQAPNENPDFLSAENLSLLRELRAATSSAGALDLACMIRLTDTINQLPEISDEVERPAQGAAERPAQASAGRPGAAPAPARNPERRTAAPLNQQENTRS